MTFIVLLPAQCAAEELVFRGFLMQSIGTWVRHPAVAIVAPVPFFVLAHLYSGWAMLDIAAFALTAGWLAWRTGGLEAAVALHVANNAVAFAVSTWVIGTIDTTTEGDAVSLAMSLIVDAVYIGLIEVLARRVRLIRTVEIAPEPGTSYISVAARDYRGTPLTVRLPAPPAVPTPTSGISPRP
nr:CPBP family intramembrane glutamic endopeptidase [Nanchangia anserum]